MANKTGFEKATSKMFKDFGPSVQIAQPGAGERVSREERDRMRSEADSAARRDSEEKRAEERRQVIQDLVDMNVLLVNGDRTPEVVVSEEAPAQPKQGRGRPAKSAEPVEYVLMNFRVTLDFRQRLKVMAARQGRPVADLFDEAFGLLFEKYHVGKS